RVSGRAGRRCVQRRRAAHRSDAQCDSQRGAPCRADHATAHAGRRSRDDGLSRRRCAATGARMILVVITAILAIVFLVTGRVTLRAAMHAIDADLLLVLFALLVAVEILRESGWLDLAVFRSSSRRDGSRSSTSKTR